MLDNSRKIVLSYNETIIVLKELEMMLMSLHYMGSYYMDKDKNKYEEETTRFIDDSKITHRLSKIRAIISSEFDNSIGECSNEILEKEMDGLPLWEKPGDTLPFCELYFDEN